MFATRPRARAIAAFARGPNDGLIVLPGLLTVTHRELFVGGGGGFYWESEAHETTRLDTGVHLDARSGIRGPSAGLQGTVGLAVYVTERVSLTGALRLESRDVFLHLAPERQAHVAGLLRERLAGQAEVVDLDEVLALGLFGRGEPHPSLRARVGNTVLLPYAHHHVWYRHRPGRLFELRGHHGGLTEREMLVPLVVGRLNEIAG